MNQINIIKRALRFVLVLCALQVNLYGGLFVGELGQVHIEGGISGEFQSLKQYVDSSSEQYVTGLQGLLNKAAHAGLKMPDIERELAIAQASRSAMKKLPSGYSATRTPNPAFVENCRNYADKIIVTAYHTDADVVQARKIVLEQRLNDADNMRRTLVYEPALALHKKVAAQLDQETFKNDLMDPYMDMFAAESPANFGEVWNDESKREANRNKMVQEISWHIFDFLTHAEKGYLDALTELDGKEHRRDGELVKVNKFFVHIDKVAQATISEMGLAAEVESITHLEAANFPGDKREFLRVLSDPRLSFAHGSEFAKYFYALVYLGIGWVKAGIDDDAERAYARVEMRQHVEQMASMARTDHVGVEKIEEARFDETNYGVELGGKLMVAYSEAGKPERTAEIEKIARSFADFREVYRDKAYDQAGSGGLGLEKQVRDEARNIQKDLARRRASGVPSRPAASGGDEFVADEEADEMPTLGDGPIPGMGTPGHGAREPGEFDLYQEYGSDGGPSESSFFGKVVKWGGLALGAIVTGSIIAHKVTDKEVYKEDQKVMAAVQKFGKMGGWIMSLMGPFGGATTVIKDFGSRVKTGVLSLFGKGDDTSGEPGGTAPEPAGAAVDSSVSGGA